MEQTIRIAVATISMLLFALPGSAQMGGMMSGDCAMCGAMGWGGMILGVLLILAIIAALGALTLYLVRRSRHFPSS